MVILTKCFIHSFLHWMINENIATSLIITAIFITLNKQFCVINYVGLLKPVEFERGMSTELKQD